MTDVVTRDRTAQAHLDEGRVHQALAEDLYAQVEAAQA